jgi:hypothetical protein
MWEDVQSAEIVVKHDGRCETHVAGNIWPIAGSYNQ